VVRALVILAILLGIVLGGLLLLRRTANMNPTLKGDRKRIEIKPEDDDEDRGW